MKHFFQKATKRLAIVVLMTIMAISVIGAITASAEQTVPDTDEYYGLSQMVPDTVTASGGECLSPSGGFSFRLMEGTWWNYIPMNWFNTTENNSVLWWDGTNVLSGFWNWQFQAIGGHDAVIAITAQRDVKMSITHDVQLAGFEAQNTTAEEQKARILIVHQTESTAQLILKKDFSQGYAANAYGGETHLKKGDKLYFIVQCDTGCQPQIIPMFHAESAAYNSAMRDEILSRPVDAMFNTIYGYDYSSMVTDSVNLSGGVGVRHFAEYQLMGGSWGSYHALNSFTGEGDGVTPAYYSGEALLTLFHRWEMLSSPNNDAVIRLKVNKDSKVIIQHGTQPTDNANAVAQGLSVKILQKAASGSARLILDKPVVNGYDANAYGAEIHAKAGDEIYYTLTGNGVAAFSIVPIFYFEGATFSSEARDTVFAGEEYFVSGFGYDFSSIVSDAVNANGEECQKHFVNYQLMGGEWGAYHALNSFTGEGDGVTAAQYADGDPAPQVLFHRWEMLASAGNDAVIRITATADTKLNITNATQLLSNEGAQNAGQKIRIIQVDESGSARLIKTENAVNNYAENAYGGEIHLKKGDTLYYVLSGNVAAFQLIPLFNFDRVNYSADARSALFAGEEYLGSEFNYNLSEMVTNTVAENGEECSLAFVKYQLMGGKWGEYHALNSLTGSGDGVTAAQYADGDPAPHVLFHRWEILASPNNDAVIRLTFTKNVMLTITNPVQIVSPSVSAGADLTVKIMQVAEDGSVRQILSKKAVDNYAANDYGATVHAKVGDTVYFVLTGNQSVFQIIPWFNFNAEAYDEAKREAVFAGEEYYEKEFGYDFSSIVTDFVTSSGAECTLNYVNYQLMAGKWGEYHSLNYFGGTGDNVTASYYNDKDQLLVLFHRWEMLAAPENDAVIRMTFTKDAKVNITNATQLVDNTSAESAGLKVWILQSDAEGNTRLLLENRAKNNYATNAYAAEAHVKAGDTLYFIITGANQAAFQVIPLYSFNAEAYDEAKRTEVFAGEEFDPTPKEPTGDKLPDTDLELDPPYNENPSVSTETTGCFANAGVNGVALIAVVFLLASIRLTKKKYAKEK